MVTVVFLVEKCGIFITISGHCKDLSFLQNFMVEKIFKRAKMVSEEDELHIVRDEIRKLYDMNKKVIVAPCRCKLYISRSTEIIDFEGKTSPNWFYFASGLTTIVYDPQTNELMLTLFDVSSVRLLWMLKMTETTHIYAPNSCFHVINTTADYSEHVGLLYECKDVASLLLNTFSLLTAQHLRPKVKQADRNADARPRVEFTPKDIEKETNQESHDGGKSNRTTEKKRRNLLRSLTFHVRRNSRAGKNDSSTDDKTRPISTSNQNGTGELISTQKGAGANADLLSSSMNNDLSVKTKDQGKRRRRLSGRSKTVGPESIPAVSTFTNANLVRNKSNKDNKRSSVPCFIVGEVEDIFPSREMIASVKSRSPREQDFKPLSKDISSFEKHSHASSDPSGSDHEKRGSIFRRKGRKISRSLSEKLPHRPQVTLRREKQGAKNNDDNANGDAKCEGKPRASSDSLLLKGSAIDCMVETGHMAKYQRERKLWMTILENESVQTTDLCVTEL